MSCIVLYWLVLPCPIFLSVYYIVVPDIVFSCTVMSYLVSCCIVLPGLVLYCLISYYVVLSCLVVCYMF